MFFVELKGDCEGDNILHRYGKIPTFIITVSDETGNIELTERGLELASYVYEKHNIISTCLIMLGVSSTTAMEDACKIEHDLSDESFDALKTYYQKIKG